MQYDYEQFFERKLREIAASDYILDVGGGRPFQKRLAKYEPWFSGKRFETVDNVPEYEPTILGDVHDLPLKNESVGAILCLSVLEHLHDPVQAAGEMRRVLKKGGKLLAYTHFIYPYHARPGMYEDYFRFTEPALRYLFRDFSHVEIRKQGGYFSALMFFVPGQATLKPVLQPIAYALDKLIRTENRRTTPGFYVYAVK